MVHLLFGDDDFSLGEHLASLKATVQPAELRDVNITVLDGTRLQFSELTSNCDTVPFLAEKRMVVVEGLLSRFERRAPSRSSASQNADPSPDISEWKALADYLPTVPETTELVFTDGALGRGNRLLASIRPHANVSTFPTLGAAQVRRWINDRATATETEIEPAAVDLLIETIGSDLRAIAAELDKLSVYRWGGTITAQDVYDLVSYSREASIFAAVDAIVEGAPQKAIAAVETPSPRRQARSVHPHDDCATSAAPTPGERAEGKPGTAQRARTAVGAVRLPTPEGDAARAAVHSATAGGGARAPP